MISVKVRWFAAYRELAGIGAETCSTNAGTVAELFEDMKLRHAAIGNRKAALVAINDQMADWNAAIADGDEILFFPPVAGG